ncbi:hypothetical protein RRG08_067114 [Elysia crispata]|uniref:Uncharacterized protein n=1 Tax=Elysia crispata TaxID=231223 RepID=A0AAE0ZIR6_9GAST|nr:hypothetical protein RRG08_067114 [Elysia crispata]
MSIDAAALRNLPVCCGLGLPLVYSTSPIKVKITFESRALQTLLSPRSRTRRRSRCVWVTTVSQIFLIGQKSLTDDVIVHVLWETLYLEVRASVDLQCANYGRRAWGSDNSNLNQCPWTCSVQTTAVKLGARITLI